MSGFGWLPIEDSERLEEEQDWIEEHGPIGLGARIDALQPDCAFDVLGRREVLDAAMLRPLEADLPQVVDSWPVLEPPLSAREVSAMPDSTAQGDHALLAIEEAVREDA